MPTVLITGANRGLGLAFVEEYLKRNDVHIIATCRTPEKAAQLQSYATSNPNRISIVQLDVSDQSSIDAAGKTVAGMVDQIDILINNAAINPKGIQALEDITPETLMESFNINSVGPLMVVKALLNLVKKGSAPKIINVSTQMGSMDYKKNGGGYAYSSSKAALNMITRGLAADLQGDGIITITLHPGWVITDMGGSSASLSAEESASSILKLIDGLTMQDNGCFFKWNGDIHAW